MLATTTCLLCLLTLHPLIHAQFEWAKRQRNTKVDCSVSSWSEWKCCGSTCGRTREVIRQPSSDGLACPKVTDLRKSDSVESPWDQSNVMAKVQSKFMVCSGGVLSCSTTAQITDGTVLQSPDTADGTILQSRDLLFLVDMSGNVKTDEFIKTKEKIADLTGLICGTIGRTRQHNRVALITFSKSITLNFDFQSYFNLSGIREAIMDIPQERNLTCTGDALYFAHTYMFDPVSGVRDSAESVKDVFILTAGRSNCGRKLSDQARKLRVKAFVFALAIGKFSPRGKAEIESMVSRPLIDHIFSLANFQKFFKMVDALKTFPGKCVPFELT